MLQRDPRVWNNLMVQFAGYQQEDGTIVGDPAAVGITKVNWTKNIIMLEGYL